MSTEYGVIMDFFSIGDAHYNIRRMELLSEIVLCFYCLRWSAILASRAALIHTCTLCHRAPNCSPLSYLLCYCNSYTFHSLLYKLVSPIFLIVAINLFITIECSVLTA